MSTYTLITGATSGIGLSTARQLSLSTNLIFVGRSPQKLDCLQKEFGNRHLFLCFDLCEVEKICDVFSDFLRRNNATVTKLIHCAGVDQLLPAKSLNSALIEQVMRVNFYSVVEILNVLLKRSVNRSALQNVLFVSSISAIRGFKAKGAYSASKAALDAFMKVLSKELAPNVCVNSILPGAIPTPMSQAGFDNLTLIKHFDEIYPLGIGTVEKVVDVIVCYHDMRNPWVTGQQIVVDGGMTC